MGLVRVDGLLSEAALDNLGHTVWPESAGDESGRGGRLPRRVVPGGGFEHGTERSEQWRPGL